MKVLSARPQRHSGAVRLLVCLALALLLCTAHVLGNRAFVLACLAGFLFVSAKAAYEGAGIDVLLFFLPWSPLLKQQVGEISFFTIALTLACVIALVKRQFRVKPHQLYIPALLFIVTLTAKLVEGNSVDRSYLLFIVTLALFPCFAENDSSGRASFKSTCLYFSAGAISAALSAQLVAGYSNIAQFINVDSWAHVTRLSGYYGDANFYSAQIAACMGGLLLILAKEESLRWRVGSIGLLIVLLYCGMLSASKSFVIVGACEFGIWVALLFGCRATRRRGLSLLLAAAVVVLFAFSTSAFQSLISIIDNRFSYAASLSELTTGRSDVWVNYLWLLSHDPSLALFGEGYTNVTLEVLRGKASHNTLIQCVFQLGLIGSPLLIAWFSQVLKGLLPYRLCGLNGWAALLMVVGVFMPWFGLDYLFFDELFLLPVFAACGICYFTDAVPVNCVNDVGCASHAGCASQVGCASRVSHASCANCVSCANHAGRVVHASRARENAKATALASELA